MKSTSKTPASAKRDPFLVGAEAALRRAARRARAVAKATGTPLVLWKDGRVVKVKV